MLKKKHKVGHAEKPRLERLSPRKRQVMEVLYRRGEATRNWDRLADE